MMGIFYTPSLRWTAGLAERAGREGKGVHVVDSYASELRLLAAYDYEDGECIRDSPQVILPQVGTGESPVPTCGKNTLTYFGIFGHDGFSKNSIIQLLLGRPQLAISKTRILTRIVSEYYLSS